MLCTGLVVLVSRCGEQRRVIEVREGDCAGCQIRLIRSAIIGPGAGRYSPLFDVAAVAKMGSGKYVIGPVNQPGAVGVYGADGRLVRGVDGIGRMYGKEGREVAGLWSFGPDSVVMVDAEQDRLLFADTGLSGARSARLFGTILDAELVPGAGLVVNSRLEQKGTLHLLARDGRFVRTLDGGDGKQGQEVVRVLAVDRAGLIYSARPHRFEIEVRTADGTLRRILRRRASWFQVPRSANLTLRPFIRDLSIDADGRLWVLGVVPRPPQVSRTRTEGEAYYEPDFILEIIDLAQSTVVATAATSKHHLVRWVAPGEIVSREHLPDGHTAFVIWKVTVEGNRSRALMVWR